VDCAYKCRSISTGEEFALKIYEIGMENKKRQIISDLHALQQIGSHPNIVKYHRVIEAERQIFVMMELLKGVDLFTLVQTKGALREDQGRHIFLQTCDALKWLHGKQIVHGDVKTENVMVLNPSGDVPVAKVIDFGFMCFLNSEGEKSQLLGDRYATPESFLGTEASFATDIFRTGCMLYVMLTARLPFKATGDSDHRQGKVLKSKTYAALSEEAKDLITKMTSQDMCERPDIDAVIAHPWCSDCNHRSLQLQ